MTAEVWPISEDFGAEIGDVDLSGPLSDTDWRIIEDAYNRFAVLVFPDQHLNQNEHIALARHFGPIDMSIGVNWEGVEARIPAEIADVSNLDADGEILDAEDPIVDIRRGNQLWHTDSSFKPTPANASLLYMKTIPPVGGLTEFADMRAAWDGLDDHTRKRIEGLVALHSISTSRKRMGVVLKDKDNRAYPQVPQAMVRTHRASGRKSIYVASHAGEIPGMTPTDAQALIDRLIAHSTQRQFTYVHRWRKNDLVIWDNRCTMHRGRRFDETRWPRDAQRATSLDTGPTCEQEGLAAVTEATA